MKKMLSPVYVFVTAICLVLVLAFVLLFVPVFTPVLSVATSVSAADMPTQKEEVVYGVLDTDGSVNKLYVVNIFNGGAITDYGSYSDIHNMTTSEALGRSGDQITINTEADKFYYQGKLERKDLPWNFAIRYFLDGKEIPGTALAGKNGSLKITLSVRQNNKVRSTFFNNYALQIAISLDNKLCSDIKTNNATIAEAGSKKQLLYTVLPGKSAELKITANVRDFEMDAISINGIRLFLDINTDSSKFTEQISELSDAIRELDNGANDLLNGTNRLSDGMKKYLDGIKALGDGSGKITDGADKLNIGATALKNGLLELAKQNDVFKSGALAIQQTAFDMVNTQFKEKGAKIPVLTPENYSAVLSAIPELSSVQKQLDRAVQFTQGLNSYMDGVTQLGQGASDLTNGLAEFKSSLSVLASSANNLYNAGAELNKAVKQLRDGLASYKDGTKELRNGTSDLGSEINEKVDEILGGITGNGDKVVSFVSDKNINVSAVQFVLKTDPIRIPDAPKAAAPTPVELNFWQKLLKLFGL